MTKDQSGAEIVTPEEKEAKFLDAMWDAITDVAEKHGYGIGGGSHVAETEDGRFPQFRFTCQVKED